MASLANQILNPRHGDMEMPYLSSGAPWMMAPPDTLPPVDRTADRSDLTEDQVALVTGYWVDWYQSDLRYSLPTVAFFLATILFFTFAGVIGKYSPRSIKKSAIFRRTAAASRYLAYKGWRITFLRWYSPPAGVWLLGAVGVIFFAAMMLAPKPYYWPDPVLGMSPPIATRSGWMSIACLPFLLTLAAKENPISLLTRVPYEKLMVFHKWVAWAMYILALVHTFPFIVSGIHNGTMIESWQTDVFYWTGVVALVAQSWLQFMSIGPIRNKFYEFFKALHYAMAALFFAFLFIHCGYVLTSWDYLIAAAVIYTVCLITSQLRVWFEHGIASYATLETAESGAVKVSIPTSSPWYPGQHIFVRFMIPSLQGLTAHPFTICSLPITSSGTTLPDIDRQTANMVFYIWPHHGLTARLSSIAKQTPSRKIRVLLDGPYGGMKERSLHTFEHGLIIAGGAGAGFTLPVIEDFLRRNYLTEGKQVSLEKKVNQLRIVIAFKTEEYRSWYQSAVRDLLTSCGLPLDTAAIKLDIYLTDICGCGTEKECSLEQGRHSSDASRDSEQYTSIHRGARPNLPALVSEIVKSKPRADSLGIAVCGPSSMLFDVRNVVADAQLGLVKDGGAGEVMLYHEHFGW